MKTEKQKEKSKKINDVHRVGGPGEPKCVFIVFAFALDRCSTRPIFVRTNALRSENMKLPSELQLSRVRARACLACNVDIPANVH